ncbi:MAG: ZIP family metal transporter [Kiritimatiellae bacterium]|nr:ZIP family metal transporter [Kiritimatiellia bacterium]MDD5522184.1 ZIP family metal transporter [Kiritimatiellia bacterium]
MDTVGLILGASLAMLATSVGAAGVLAFKKVNDHLYSRIIAFSAGMMAFSAFEMIMESHAAVGHRMAVAGVLIGIITFAVLDKLLPHTHQLLLGSEMPDTKRKAALLVGTITIHNIPEGFAIASAFADSSALGWLVAISIALQDIPEGMIVSAPVACYGATRKRAFLWGAFSGLVEFIGAIVGFLFLKFATTTTPFALGFSGGAMFCVILLELLPDALQTENRHGAVAMFIVGLILAYSLSILIGF